MSSASVAFDRIEVRDDAAIVWWHSDTFGGSNSLEKRFGRWWLLSGISDPCISAWDGTISFGKQYPLRAANDGYVVGLQFGANDAPSDAAIESFMTRAPTLAESWVTPGGNGYFFFSGTVQSTRPVRVRAGTAIEIQFPFVLDASLRYSLTIGGAGFRSIGPIDGTLADNRLHFVLPAFVATPGVDLMGEIDGD